MPLIMDKMSAWLPFARRAKAAQGLFLGRASGPGRRRIPGPLGRCLTVQGQTHFGDHCCESLRPLRLRDHRRHRTCSSSGATRSERAWRQHLASLPGARVVAASKAAIGNLGLSHAPKAMEGAQSPASRRRRSRMDCQLPARSSVATRTRCPPSTNESSSAVATVG